MPSSKLFISTVAIHMVKKMHPEKRKRATVREYRPVTKGEVKKRMERC